MARREARRHESCEQPSEANVSEMGLNKLKASLERLRDQSGAALVEFSLVAIVLFTMVALIVQGGLVFGAWLAITNAAREGARYAAPCINREAPYNCQYKVYADDDAVEARVRDMAQGWLDTSSDAEFDVHVLHDGGAVTVTVECTVANFSPIPSFNDLHLTAESVMRTEVQVD